MSDPFVGEIKLVGFNFPPRGYAACNGQSLPINQNAALFSLVGTSFGGDGRTNFNLPNLVGSVTMGAGVGAGLTPRQVGTTVGAAAVTLTTNQIPLHSHLLNGATLTPQNQAQNVAVPDSNAMYGLSNPGPAYISTATPDTPMAPQAIGLTGGTQAHDNMHPYTAVNFVIALQGIYPQRP